MTSRSSASKRAKEPIGERFEPAFRLACDSLARRARSEAEIRERLGRAGVASATIDQVVARLRELRYLDDPAFARQRAGSLARRGFGPRAVELRLARAGLAGELAQHGIREAFGADEARLAREALARRLGDRPSDGLDVKERARLFRWLAGRGFSPGAIRAAFEPGRPSDDPLEE
ncbi:regulatory protein RecX [Vulgatibacter incomptus]|uniref:Regulatory protein RecX n=1 Tax=Vulgatibacter incomptus TaxID=1391653 RepID=A0A0K1P9X7_9BACT|nr:regulatory protein RecX [Vulgatibacter incomptus]AKU90216.1 Regulatory protein recX [Vulgatibacter incomptus]